MSLYELLDQLQIDQATLLSRFSGNAALLERFLHKFPQEPTFIELKRAVEQKKTDEMLMASHTLKGISANLGMDALCAACSVMVGHLRSGCTDEAMLDFLVVQQEYEHIRSCIAHLD